ncbi:MAG: NhaA family Na+:H+ antiporter [Woeseiaceae bacterium]|jgi:NhaA family Na+:H+ antiporter
MKATIKEFLRLETAGGILLIGAAVLAMIAANTPLREYYDLLLDVPVEFRIGELIIAKPLVLWINDGLMAVFFFLVGLELKREVVEGELSQLSNIVLPFAGAIGGIAVPVAIYTYFNHDDPMAMNGWAVPTATDIAFSLGLLSLFSDRVPVGLKVFLVTIAIFDDVAAVVIIALFYSGDLSVTALVTSAICLAILTIMNRKGVSSVSPYIWVGMIMWIAVLKSGVHATLAGIALAAFIPMRSSVEEGRSPLKELESDLHHVVAFMILPIFAFANAGVSFQGIDLEYLLHPVPIGIALGLFLGKQLGVFGICWLVIKLGFAKLPRGSNWGSLYGISVMCGIGFTMSMFIGSLAFESSGMDIQLIFDDRLGTIVGSLASATLAYIVLHFSLPKNK